MQCKQGRSLCHSLHGLLAKCLKSWKRKRSAMIHHVKAIHPLTGVCVLTIVHSIFSLMAGLIVEMLFICL